VLLLLLPLEHLLSIHCWSHLLPDLLSPSSLLLSPPSRSPLPFLSAAAALLLDPCARSPAVALQEPLPDLLGSRAGGDGSRADGDGSRD